MNILSFDFFNGVLIYIIPMLAAILIVPLFKLVLAAIKRGK